jgi:tetratricopeptide (TPR) repeat protein
MDAETQELLKHGYELLKSGEDLDKAEKIFNEALNNYPEDINILFQLASVNGRKGNHGASLAIFKHIISLAPESMEAINNIGFIYKQLGMREEAIKAFSKAVDIAKASSKKQDLAFYYENLGSMYLGNGTPQKAMELINKAIEINPENKMSLWNRSLAYLEMGDYENGFKEYDYGDRMERTRNRDYGIKDLPYWDGTPGKTVVIYGEQGIGDEFMFATILPDIMADCKVILDMHPRVANMFRYIYPNIPIFGTRKVPNERGLPWAKYYPIDAKVSIASLGKFYRKKREDFPGTPYLKVPPHLVNKYREKLDGISDKPKVGISWKGGTLATYSLNRKIKLKQLVPLLDLDGQVDFISLQYHKDSQKYLDKLKEETGKTIHHWQNVMDDYDETAGLVANLDYIISVPQSVVHLAGAIGKPTLQLCPKKGLWQMGPYGENMPWYSCVENIWQDDTEQWEPVILKAKEKLCTSLQKTT